MQLQGIAAAPGITIGPVFQFHAVQLLVDQRLVHDTAGELKLLRDARHQASVELEALYARATREIGADQAAIFDAHLAFLEDPVLFAEIEALITHEPHSAAHALSVVFDEASTLLAAGDDPLFQARSADLQDIKLRLIRILTGSNAAINQPSVPSVILAHDLLPSQVMLLDRGLVLALCTAAGGVTSHVAILARALGLPAIVGLGQSLQSLPDGMLLAVDGAAGIVHATPSAAQIAELMVHHAAAQGQRAQDLAHAHMPAQTSDGLRLAIHANISTLAEATDAQHQGAEGIGLLRTELLFLDRSSAPSEDEQLARYRAIADAIGRQPVTIRTFDMGGDKPVVYLDQPAESNPVLGIRGVRLAHSHPELLRAQLRAIWRIGPSYPISIMFPMITSIDELVWLRRCVDDTHAELLAENEPLLDSLQVGIMVEVPSAAIIAQHFAPLVDFFSIGTNDLTQYTLAADRSNPGLGQLSDALHPAVINLIAQTARAAHAHGKQVGVCGELAGDTHATSLLLGLGVTSLSMTPVQVPAVKAKLRLLNSERSTIQAQQALQQPTTAAVRALLLEV